MYSLISLELWDVSTLLDFINIYIILSPHSVFVEMVDVNFLFRVRTVNGVRYFVLRVRNEQLLYCIPCMYMADVHFALCVFMVEA